MTRRSDPKLRPAAQFSSRTIADEAWATLMEEGVPATVEHTPRTFGQGGFTRVFVAEVDLSRAQEVLAPYVAQDSDG